MKTFKDLEFIPHLNPYMNGIRAAMKFVNGNAISVVRLKIEFDGHEMHVSYTNNDDEWEVCYWLVDGNRTIISHCDKDKVTDIMALLQERIGS